MTEDHATYSPSRLERILECPASIPLERALKLPPEPPSVYAQHGTKLHGVTDHVTTKGISVLPRFELDISDKALVLDCVDYLDTLIKAIGHSNYRIQSESRVSLRDWGIPEVWGTLDKSVTDNVQRHIHVIDWKFGSGVPVFAEENPQLLAYAAGAVGYPTAIKTITMHVVQPAIENYSTWTISLQELFDWVHGVLAKGINKANQDDPCYKPGEKQCRWCPNRFHCDARYIFIQDQAVQIFKSQQMLPKTCTPNEIAEFLKMAPVVEQAIKDFKQYITIELSHGHQIPGFKLVTGRSNRYWPDEKKAMTWLAEKSGIEELFISKLISPAQAEKLNKALKADKEFGELWSKDEGKPTLVSENDPRPAMQIATSAQEVFKYFSVPDKLE